MLFLACYLPSCVCIYITNFCTSCNCVLIHWVRDIQWVLVMANSGLKPFVYARKSENFQKAFNPLSANIHKLILLTDLHTFSYCISWENLLKVINNFTLVIILLILVTFSVDYVLIM